MCGDSHRGSCGEFRMYITCVGLWLHAGTLVFKLLRKLCFFCVQGRRLG